MKYEVGQKAIPNAEGRKWEFSVWNTIWIVQEVRFQTEGATVTGVVDIKCGNSGWGRTLSFSDFRDHYSILNEEELKLYELLQ